jgi:hypothetical protein
MKRHVVIIAVLLLVGGLVANLMVALACSQTANSGIACMLPLPDAELRKARFPINTPTPTSSEVRKFIATASAKWAWPAQMYLADGWTDFGFETRSYAATPYDWWHGPRVDYYESGWPFLCFDGALGRGPRSNSVSLGGMLSLGRFHPISPRWPAIAANSTVYAFVLMTIWFVSTATLKFLKRLIYFGPGLCPKCGYNLCGGLHERCPECGAAVKRVETTDGHE